MATLVAGDMVGPYRLLRHLGAGGGGREVWLAESSEVRRAGGAEAEVRREVALKLIPGAGGEAVEALQEWRAGGVVSSPHVVRTLDVGEAGAGLLYIATEYIDGWTLADLQAKLRRAGVLHVPLAVVEDVALGACAGLKAVHDARDPSGPLELVHRDIKPTNLMVDRTGAVRLLDFGIARGRSSLAGDTQQGFFKGTRGYVAPEQVMGERVGPPADLYALGVVLFELRVGARLFGDDLQGILRRQTDGSVRRRVEAEAPLLGQLTRPLQRLLEPDPRARHARVDDLVRDVQAARTRRERAGGVQPGLKALVDLLAGDLPLDGPAGEWEELVLRLARPSFPPANVGPPATVAVRVGQKAPALVPSTPDPEPVGEVTLPPSRTAPWAALAAALALLAAALSAMAVVLARP